MKKLFLLLSLFTLLPLFTFGQSTTVSVTVVDASTQAYANGTISYQFRPNPSLPTAQYSWNSSPLPSNYLTPTTVSLDGSGHASFSLPSNSFIVPSGSSWTFVVCPNASIACTTVFATVSGSSLDISSTINAAIPSAISMSFLGVPKAYQDSEVKTVVQWGGIYYNVTMGCIRLWNGSSWACIGGGGGSGCTLTGVPNSSVIYTLDGSTCTGDGNFSYFPGSNGLVILNNNQDGSITRFLIEAQQDSTGGVGTNEVLISGQNISVFSDGGGSISPGSMLGVDVEYNDANYPGSSTENLTGYQAILQPTVSGRPVTGYVASIDLQGVVAGTVQGFEVDDNNTTPATNFYGYRTKLLGADGVTDDASFFAGDINKAKIQSNYCDVLAYSSDPIQRLALGCGPDATSDFYGLVRINNSGGDAGGDALQQGASPNSGAPPSGYVGFTGPTTVTNNYWIPIPGTFPGASLSAFACSGTSSPVSCSWSALPTITSLFVTSTDVTGSRSLATTYHNTGTTPMYVSGYATVSSGSGDSTITFLIGPSSPTLSCSSNSTSVTISGEKVSFQCLVPAGSFYEVTGTNLISAIGSWIEIQ